MQAYAEKEKRPQPYVSAKPANSKTAASDKAQPNPNLQWTFGPQAVLQLKRASSDGSEKLAVNTPGDSYEQEADHISAQVMQMPEPQLQRACACGGGCSKCQAGALDHAHEHVQTKHIGSSDSGQTSAPPLVHEALASPGQPLDAATRAFMEPRFGHDFSHVRVHSGPEAARSTRAVNALAYTVGPNIVVGADRFAPATQQGRSLLAHELTHVVQQGAGQPMLQRAPRSPGATAREAPCTTGPLGLPVMKPGPKTKDKNIESSYSLGILPGHFCDMRPKTVGLLKYQRDVHIFTAQGHEATLHVQADSEFYPPFNPRRSDLQQLNVLGWSNLRWEVRIKYADALAGPLTGWHTPLDGHHRIPSAVQALAEYANTQAPPFVHFFVSAPQQRQTLEDFVQRSAEVEIPAERKRVEEWRKKHPPQPRGPIDDTAISNMSEVERYNLAREKTWEASKTRLNYMWNHPRETLKGFAESALLLNSPEVFSAIGKDLTELFDSDANGWGRAAAGVGAASKISGWLAGVLGVLAIGIAIVAFLTGVGEVATLVAAAVILAVVAIGLAVGESELRIKAASQSKNAKEFNRQVDAAAAAQTNGIVGGVLIIATAILRITGKAIIPKGAQQKFQSYLDGLKEGIKKKTGAKPGSGPNDTPGPVPPDDIIDSTSGTTPRTAPLTPREAATAFRARYPKLSQDAATLAGLEDIFRRSTGGTRSRTTRPGQFLPSASRAAAAELDAIRAAQNDPAVVRIRSVPPQSGPGAQRTPDFIVDVQMPDGSIVSQALEVRTVTGGRSGYQQVGPRQSIVADVDAVANAIRNKVFPSGKPSQLTGGGDLAIQVRRGGPNVETTIAEAVSRLNPRLLTATFLRELRFPLTDRRVVRYVRGPGGLFVLAP